MEEKTQTAKSGAGLLFGEWLVNKGLLTHRKLCDALSEQHRQGGRLGEVLLRLEMLNDQSLTNSLAEYPDLDYFSLDNPATVA